MVYMKIDLLLLIHFQLGRCTSRKGFRKNINRFDGISGCTHLNMLHTQKQLWDKFLHDGNNTSPDDPDLESAPQPEPNIPIDQEAQLETFDLEVYLYLLLTFCILRVIRARTHVTSRMPSVFALFLSPPVQLARWAHMYRFLSVCLSLDLNSLDNNSYLRKYWS